MKSRSLSTHCHADKRSSEVLLVHMTFLKLHYKTALQRSPTQLKLQPAVHQYEQEQIMTGFSFFGELWLALSLKERYSFLLGMNADYTLSHSRQKPDIFLACRSILE